VFVDPDLLQYDEVWAAAGTWNDVFGANPNDIMCFHHAGNRHSAQIPVICRHNEGVFHGQTFVSARIGTSLRSQKDLEPYVNTYSPLCRVMIGDFR